jgi:hypothetical protein
MIKSNLFFSIPDTCLLSHIRGCSNFRFTDPKYRNNFIPHPSPKEAINNVNPPLLHREKGGQLKNTKPTKTLNKLSLFNN